VFYKVAEFLEKNKDKMGEDLEKVLKQSYLSFEPPKTMEQLQEEEHEFLNSAKGRAKPKILTLGGQFKLQLDELVKKLNESAPHFIRCVRPNDSKQPEFFHGVCVHQQLKQSGAFDALAIRKRGYNFQFKHEVFISRYGSLVRDKSNRRMSSVGSTSRREVCIEIIKQLSKLPNMENATSNIQVGNSMVFWKASEDRHLSGLRRQEISAQVVSVQKIVRGRLTRKHFKALKEDVRAIGQLVRGIQNKRNVEESTLPHENKSMEDILSAKLKLRSMKIKLPAWEKTIEAESKITNDRIEALNRVDNVKDLAPKDINEQWLNAVEKAQALNLHSPELAKLFHIHRDFTEKCAPLLRKIGVLVKNGDDVSIPIIQGLLAEIRGCHGSVPGFAEKEEAKLHEMLRQLEMENQLMDNLLKLCSGSAAGKMPGEDYSRQIQDFAATNKSAVGKRVKAALRLVDYMFEVREAMLKTTRRATNDDVTAKPIMPPPPPPKRFSNTGRAPGQPPPPPGRRESGLPPPPPPRAGSAPPPPPPPSTGSVGQADLWSPVELLFKQYGEVVAAVSPAGVDSVVVISGSEIDCYKLVIADCKAIVADGAAALGARNVPEAERVVGMIQEFNENFPTRAPYLMACRDRPSENDRGYGMLIPDVNITKLFAALSKMLSMRIEALKKEDDAVKCILRALDEDAIVIAGDLFSPDRRSSDRPALHDTGKLERALQSATACCSGASGYLYPTTDSVIRMAEYILSLRKLALDLIGNQLSSDSSVPANDKDRDGWSDLQKLVSQDKHHQAHIPSKNASEINALRNLLLDRNAALVDAEKTKEIANSLRRAITDEDEGQVKYLLSEIDALPEQQKAVMRSKEKIEPDIASGKELLDNLEAVKAILAAAVDMRPFTANAIEKGLADADAFNLKSTPSLDAYVQLNGFLDKFKECVAKAHRAWNNGDVNEMMNVLDEASENDIDDEEFELLRFLVAKWHEDYGAFLRALIDLNTFLQRNGEVASLNEKLNNYYFSLRPPPPPEPAPVVIDMNDLSLHARAPSKLEFQARLSAGSNTHLDNNVEKSLLPPPPAGDPPADEEEPSVSRVQSTIARFASPASMPVFIEPRKRQDSRQIGGNLVKEMIKMREQQALLSNQMPQIVEPKRYVKRFEAPEELPPEEESVSWPPPPPDYDDELAAEHDYGGEGSVGDIAAGDIDVMTVRDEEGDVYIWYRFKNLRRFADPDLEFARKMFSTEDIPTSVTRITDPIQIRMAIASFKCLLGAMGDQVCNYPKMMVDEFCSIAKKNQELADEAYCQLVKQLTANPSQSSRSKGIAILRRLVDVVIPSQALEPYIEHFLRDNSELELLHLLQLRIRSSGVGSGEQSSNQFAGFAGYLTLVKGKLIKVNLHRYCVINSETMTISMNDDPSSRVDALLVCQIREVRVRKGVDNVAKCRYPFELEMKSGIVKVFYAK
jgi:hypothetical protein